MTQNSVIGWIAIISSIGSELVDLIIDLIKQWLKLRGVACFLICQAMGNDLATVGINSQVQLAPAAAGLRSVLLLEPLAGAIYFQPGTVDQNVNGSVRHMLRVVASDRRLPCAGPLAQSRVIFGTGKSNPIMSSTEPRSPSLWRKRNPNTMPSISVVSIARSEYRG